MEEPAGRAEHDPVDQCPTSPQQQIDALSLAPPAPRPGGETADQHQRQQPRHLRRETRRGEPQRAGRRKVAARGARRGGIAARRRDRAGAPFGMRMHETLDRVMADDELQHRIVGAAIDKRAVCGGRCFVEQHPCERHRREHNAGNAELREAQMPPCRRP